jgi:hypothetical protein
VPAIIRVHQASRVSYLVMTGIVNGDTLVTAQRALTHAADFDPTFGLVLDMRAADDIQLTRKEMRQVALLSPLDPSARLAILVRGDGAYGIARLYEIVRESQRGTAVVEVCRTVDEAARWLGVKHLDI